jgi:hypothetical protein
MQKKNVLLLTVIITIIVVVIGSKISQNLFQSDIKLEKKLIIVAEKMNEDCPYMVDIDTRLDSTFGGPNRNFTYNYTLVNYKIGQVDTIELKNKLEPQILNNVRTNPAIASFRRHQVTMIYKYYDNLANFIMDIKIAPDDYKN